MITNNADGTYTVVGMVTCRTMAAAEALLADIGFLVDPLTVQAAKAPLAKAVQVRVDRTVPGGDFIPLLIVEHVTIAA